jgi:hypothetical protein
MGSIYNPVPTNAQGSSSPAFITQPMIDSLRRTKPWVRFLSILGFILTGFIVLLGIVLALGVGFLSSISKAPFGGISAVLIGCVYVALGLIYVFPAVYLFRYADGIQKALTRDLVSGVEHALRNQKSFWTFAGVFVLIVLILQVLLLAFIILAGVAGLAGLRGLQG